MVESLKYLTHSDVDESWGIFVTTIGFQIVKPFAPFPPKGHPPGYFYNPKKGRILDEYGLIFFTKGKGTFSSSHVKQEEIRPGTLIMIFPGEWHTYEPIDKAGWESYWVHFKGDFVDAITKRGFYSKKDPIFKIGLNETLIDLYNQAIFFAEQEKAAFQQILGSFIINVLGLLYYLEKNESFAKNEIINRINIAKSLIRERSDAGSDLKTIAENLNMSYSSFRKMFKLYTGISPMQYVLQLKIHKAKALLTTSNLSIKEIAYDLHFNNPDYFSVFFKHQTGKTPEQFRNESRVN